MLESKNWGGIIINKDVYRELELNGHEMLSTLSRYSSQLLFRGQWDDSWPLVTSIERALGNDDRGLDFFEEKIIHEFKRNAKNYLPYIPNDDDILEWLSIIQHYGGPTRLLDFSHSIFIAAFFALGKSIIDVNNKTDAAIWAVNSRYLYESIKKKYVDMNDVNAILKNSISIRDSSKNSVMFAEPYNKNKRLHAQQGLFLFPLNMRLSFEENLFGTFDAVPNIKNDTKKVDLFTKTSESEISNYFNTTCILKIVIPHALHSTILERLNMMNINYSILYPDIEGLARNLYGIKHLKFSKSMFV